MNEKATVFPDRPRVRPQDPRFSSGPCKKHPGWDVSKLSAALLGRSHRAAVPKKRLQEAIERSHRLAGLPGDWKVAIMPGSDSGAFEAAMWSMLGTRPVDVLSWENFSAVWAKDLAAMGIEMNSYEADYGDLPDVNQVNPAHDVVTVYNGTSSGVCMPNLDWIDDDREGLVLCDATSALFSVPIDFSKLDVVTWSWQKVLGGEAAHGMLAIGPRAIERLETTPACFPLPKVFQLTKKGKLDEALFAGATLNTPSMLALEDLFSALDWADSVGGLDALWQRTEDNFNCIRQWVDKTPWIDWLASDPATRAKTGMTLRIVAPWFAEKSEEQQRDLLKSMLVMLEQEDAALDIGSYRTAPPGFRIWGGATVETADLEALLPWLEWVYSVHQPEVEAVA